MPQVVGANPPPGNVTIDKILKVSSDITELYA